MPGLLILLGVLAIPVIFGIVIFNQLVMLKHHVSKAWSNIDILLTQRHEALPRLIETCRQSMKQDQEILEKVMQARRQVSGAQATHNIPALSDAETALRMSLENLFAVVETYPELKASLTFQHVQERISGLTQAIADHRESYNESVRANNLRVEQFPATLVAWILGFRRLSRLRFSNGVKKDIDLRQLFNP